MQAATVKRLLTDEGAQIINSGESEAFNGHPKGSAASEELEQTGQSKNAVAKQKADRDSIARTVSEGIKKAKSREQQERRKAAQQTARGQRGRHVQAASREGRPAKPAQCAASAPAVQPCYTPPTFRGKLILGQGLFNF